MADKEKTAIIIGAGPAGLTAAYYMLKETGIIPHIYEESPNIGGISRTEVHNGNRIDIGGHRFFSKSKLVNDIWNELIPAQGAPAMDKILMNRRQEIYGGSADPEQADQVMLSRTRVSRILFLRKFFHYPISMEWKTFRNMGFFRTIYAGFGYIFSMLVKRKEESLEDFYINRFGKPLYQMFFQDYTKKVWGVSPANISPDWGAQRVKGLSLLKTVKNMLMKKVSKRHTSDETSLIEAFSYPKYGPGQLWETMAARIEEMGGKIYLNHRVTGIRAEAGRILSLDVIRDADEQLLQIPGDYFFSSMPVKDLINGMGAPVPDAVRKIAGALPYRDFITVGLLVKKLQIDNDTDIPTYRNRVPDCWIYIQEKNVKMGRLQIFNNWSPYMVKDYENTLWVGLEYFCNEGDSLWDMDRDAFIEMAKKELEDIHIISADDVLDATYIRVKKAYPAYFGTYQDFDEVRAYLDSFDNLFCIGRNGQHRYNNMDHSMLTAIEAVRAVQNKTTKKDDIWNVNTETEYHEQDH